MKKELTNTFQEGLIQDLNPLTTPNNVLTDALNATFITYNGNEFSLQNDMGNSKIGTASLPAGYIPVGIKEYGGIIYVASHNPITKKSQIGSFPSPQQLFNGEDLNVSELNINFNKFIDQDNHIKLEYYKEKLFVDKDTGKAKKFYPGDRFLITVPSIDQEIIDAAKEGILTFKLGVITKNGNFEYIDNSKLRIYNEQQGFWIFCYQKDLTVENLLKDKSLIQVYNAKTSGELLLIIEYKTIQAFNLIRDYIFNDETNQKEVHFFGKFDSYNPKYSGYTTENNEISLYDGQLFKDKFILTGNNNKVSFNFTPTTTYGILDRLKKSGIIDFSQLKENSELMDEWRFYITDNYIKIGWSYQYINSKHTISKLKFSFLDFIQSENFTLDNIIPVSEREITRDYYNGNFEEIIYFNNYGLKKQHIYIVKIDRYIDDDVKLPNPFYQLLYTGTYFNNMYEHIFNYNNLDKDVCNLNYYIDNNIKIVEPSTYDYYIKTNTETQFTKKDLNIYDFKCSFDTNPGNVDNYRYVTKKQGTYKIIDTITPVITNMEEFAGDIKIEDLQNYVYSNINLQLGDIDNSNKSYSNISTLTSELPLESFKEEFTTDNKGKFETNLTINRSIIANSSQPKNESYEVEALFPLYYKNMPLPEQRKVFGFKVANDFMTCVGGSEDSLRYNSQFFYNGGFTKGPKPGSGKDGDLIVCHSNMGNALVNVMIGFDGDDASLGYPGQRRRSPQELDGWSYAETKPEVDKHDNYIIAMWKTETGVKLINLASPKWIGIGKNITRCDYMLKCFLSQILTVRKKLMYSYRVFANPDNYVFHKAFDSKINIKYNFTNTSVDIESYLFGDNKSIKERMAEWQKLLPNLKDFIPSIKIAKTDIKDYTISFGKSINIETDADLLRCYTEAQDKFTDKVNTQYDSNRIYLGVPTGSADSDFVMPLQKDSRGFYMHQNEQDEIYIYDWHFVKQNLPRPINEMFVTRKNQDGFVEVLANELLPCGGSWYKLHKSPAVTLLKGIHFGNSRLYE